MNVGDLVRIVSETHHPSVCNKLGNMGIIINEMETSWAYVEEGAPIDTSFPELFFGVYNFSEKSVLVYNSFEMKILNKAPLETSKVREDI